MRRPALLVFAVAALSALLGARTAGATPNFPGAIKSHLTLASQPPCAVCHQNGVTGLGTVTTPFGTSMRARGLQANDTGSLNTALDALSAEGRDSDGDGTGDIAELVAGSDPNTAGGSNASTLTPVYGCGGNDLSAPAAPSVVAGTLGAFGLFGLTIFARRRR